MHWDVRKLVFSNGKIGKQQIICVDFTMVTLNLGLGNMTFDVTKGVFVWTMCSFNCILGYFRLVLLHF